MSNATTLQTNNNKLSANNTDLASILNTINNLPEAGSGGGSATPDTCTISIDFSNVTSGAGKLIKSYSFGVYKNGQYTTQTIMDSFNQSTLTVNDVVCGSDFYFTYGGVISVISYNFVTNNINDFSFDNSKLLITGKAPTTAGANGTIVIESLGGGDDGPPEM